MSVHRYMTTAERFDAQTVPVPEAGCWLWLGVQVKGYGQFQVTGQGRILAHRYALEQSLGRPIRPGMLACHKCDTPSCVNPDHIYEGTLEDNARDKVSRGRVGNAGRYERTHRSRSQGTHHHSSKLTPADVRDLRASGASLREIATRYGISTTSAAKVLARQTWKLVS